MGNKKSKGSLPPQRQPSHSFKGKAQAVAQHIRKSEKQVPDLGEDLLKEVLMPLHLAVREGPVED